MPADAEPHCRRLVAGAEDERYAGQRERKRNPPAYAFQGYPSCVQRAIRSELTIPVLFPHMIAARPRHGWGTVTVTGPVPARTTRPFFLHQG